MFSENRSESFLRLPQVLAIIPISKSAWWQGCKDGRYPQPIKLGPRTTVWRSADIFTLVRRLSGQNMTEENTNQQD